MSVINSERDFERLLQDLGVTGEFSAADHKRIAERLPIEALLEALASKAAPLEYTRANLPAAKANVLSRLFEAWLKVPEHRLGQLLSNAHSNLFYAEDASLIKCVEAFVSEYTAPRA